MIAEIPGMLEAMNLTLTHLLTQVETGDMKGGTSLTGSICEVEVHGKKFEIQLRIESNPQNFIGEKEVLVSRTLNSVSAS